MADMARCLIGSTKFRRMLAGLSLPLAEKDIWSPERERNLTKIAQHCEWPLAAGSGLTYHPRCLFPVF